MKIKIGFHKRRCLFAFICVFPFILGFVLFTLRPLYETFRYSFSQTKFLPDATVKLKNVGFDNYYEVIMADSRFKLSVLSALKEIGYMTPMIAVTALVVSLLLNTPIKGRAAFRAVFFLPVVLLQGPLLNIMNSLGVFSISGAEEMLVFAFVKTYAPVFISTPILYIIENFAVVVWHSGVPILICLAGMQKMDKMLYEAAQVDGASPWQIFWKLTLPMSKPFILLSVVYTIVDFATSADNAIIQLIQDTMFTTSNGFGFPAAVTWLYFIFILLLNFIAFALLKERSAARRGLA